MIVFRTLKGTATFGIVRTNAAGEPGEIRTLTYQGREHLAFTITALVEGVIRPSNSTGPELAKAEQFGHVPAAWNGRPLTSGHPTVEGRSVSANAPEVLELWKVGEAFHAVVDDKALRVEGYVDVGRARDLGGDAERLAERLEDEEQVEVSVGVFVDLLEEIGSYFGQAYEFVWMNVMPDHIALLREDEVGACSIAMGCGAPRVATGGQKMAGENTDAPPAGARVKSREKRVGDMVVREDYDYDVPPASAAGEIPTTPTRENYGLMARIAAALGFRAGITDRDLREALELALAEADPGFLGISDVENGEAVIYHAFAESGGGTRLYKRGFKMQGKKVVLDDDKQAVRTERTFVPAEAGVPATETPKAAGGCGCGGTGNQAASVAAQEQHMKTKTERVKALVDAAHTTFTAADQAALEAVPDAVLDTIEKMAETEKAAADAKAADEQAAADKAAAEKAAADAAEAAKKTAEPVAAKQLSEEEWRKTAPASVIALLDAAKAAEAAEKADLVATLTGAQTEFTEAQLKAKGNDELRSLARLLKAVVPQVDFSGFALPRAAAAKDDVYMNPPDAWAKPEAK